MKSCALRLVGGLLLAASALPAQAQQNIPGPALSDFKAQGVPDSAWPMLPGKAKAREDACRLGSVSASELLAVRESIIERLHNNDAARTSFLSEEKLVQADCARARAAFYIKVMAKIHTNKIK